MKLKEFLDKIEPILPDESNSQPINTIIDLESALTVEAIKVVLDRPEYSVFDPKTRLNAAYVEPFLKVLQQHADNIALTDALPQYSPDTPANKCAKILSATISEHKLAKNETATTLLYPLVNKANAKVKLGSKRLNEIASLPQQSFVWEDSGKNIILLNECLKRVDSRVRDNAADLCLFKTSDYTKPLSETERARVINHSDATKKFYDACKKAADSGNATQQVMEALRRELREDLAYSANKVNYAYGKAGNDLLAERVYQGIKTINDLITSVAKLDKALWNDYVAYIPAAKAKDLLSQAEANLSNLISPQAEVDPRLALFVMYGLYSRDRGLQPNVKPDYPGLRFIAPLIQYTGKQKTNAAHAVMSLLVNLKFSLESIAKILDKSTLVAGLEDIKQADPARVDIVFNERGTLWNGELGVITKALVDTYKPQEIIEQEVKVANKM